MKNTLKLQLCWWKPKNFTDVAKNNLRVNLIQSLSNIQTFIQLFSFCVFSILFVLSFLAKSNRIRTQPEINFTNL